MKKVETWIRSALLSVAGSVGLFTFFAFLTDGVLSMSLLEWYAQEVSLFHSYVIVPWGMALCLLRLKNRVGLPDEETRWDVRVLLLLLAWIIVPFALRFGLTFNNIGSWHGYATVYFGVYALLSEKSAKTRERELDVLLALCGVLTLALCGALLYCVWSGRMFSVNDTSIAFGFVQNAGTMNLSMGMHYNNTGMVSVCLVMLALCGGARAKHVPARALYYVAAVMAALVVVLTQSRTSRYAMLVALAAGAYSVIAGRIKKWKKELVRQVAALAVACAVLFGGYALANDFTHRALQHYTDVLARQEAGIQATNAAPMEEPQMASELKTETPSAPAETITAQEDAEQENEPQVREAVDGTFSERTIIWSNLFKLWQVNPKHMLIGNGVGRTGSRIVQGTVHENGGAVAVHNTYLQYIADFGLIGFGLLVAFLCIIFVPVLRVFFARGAHRAPGYTALCMLVMVCLMTGMMESQPMGCMTPMNVMTFFALALLARRGHELGRLVK